MTSPSRLIPALVVLTALLSACPKKPAPAPAPAPVNQDSIAREQARRDSIDRARQAEQAAAAERERMERERMAVEQRMVAARAALTAAIYFDLDQSDITGASQATLDAKLPLLNANPGLRLRIAGHTDERGSDEYNLALGQRRAAAAKRYLTQHGIAEGRIEIISFGEERPAQQGGDESAWSQNRRDEFEIAAGGDTLTLPQ